MHQTIHLCLATHSHKQRNFRGILESIVKMYHNPSLGHLNLLFHLKQVLLLVLVAIAKMCLGWLHWSFLFYMLSRI